MAVPLPMIERKNRVFLVGAGRRIQNNFLPALVCLSNSFDICGIHSRTATSLKKVADAWQVPAIYNIADFDFSEVDTIAVSVPTAQNAVVLRQLEPNAQNLDLVIDTPIAWNTLEHAEIAPLIPKFRSVTVTEDYMNFPRFALMRQAAKSGLIGELRSLTLYNIGYFYHGLALIRSFVGFGLVKETWSKKIAEDASATGYEFEGGFRATVVGPYRRHTTGGVLLEGTTGFISEFPFDLQALNPVKQGYLLSEVTTDGQLTGFEICGKSGQACSVDLNDMRRMRAMQFADKSDLNLERGCGLISIFQSVLGVHNINWNYRAADAFYDGFVSRRAEAGEMPVDPFNTFGNASAERMAWIAKSPTFIKKSIRNAAELDEGQKIKVEAGSRLEAESSLSSEGHLILGGVKLDGTQLPNISWFIYAPSWEAAIQSDHR